MNLPIYENVESDQELTLEEQQFALETLSVTNGIARYYREVTKRVEANQEAQLQPHQRLLKQAILPMSQAITEFVDSVLGGKVKRKARAAYVLDGLNPEVISFITGQSILNGISKQATRLSSVLAIVKSIEDHLYFEAFQKQHPAMYYKLDKSLKTEGRHKIVVLRRYAKKLGVEFETLEHTDKVILGEFLVELFITHTGLVETVSRFARKKEVSYLCATPATIEWMKNSHSQCSLLAPMHLPMVVKPTPWTNPVDGGYRVARQSLVKSSNKAYLSELCNVDMPVVYTAINAIQDTAWKINVDVLDVFREVWNAGETRGNLTPANGEDMPEYPAEDIDQFKIDQPEAFKECKRARSRIYAKNAKTLSKRMSTIQKLYIAEKLKDAEAIYFPHTLDWRGRIYPIVPHLNPQSDDLAKGLLCFSQGVPLTERGAFWLGVHLSNVFGNDKVSLEDRVKWAEEHSALICMVALDPLAYRFWEKADKPWMFLAACFEWNNYKSNGLGVMTYLSNPLDGSNNGLQHLAAMRLDEVGGSVVNLVPHDVPADSYAEVAKVVERKFQLGTTDADIFWRGKVDRALVKSNVMTLCYGATRRGMIDQVKAELAKRQEKGVSLIDLDAEESWDLVQHLASTIYASIGEVVVAAREIMDWLQKVAKLISSNNLPIHWVTPAGFHVLQAYKVTNLEIISTTVGSVRIDRKLAKPTIKIDSRKQVMGLSPNVVHSLDSAHLMLTASSLANDGMTSFAFIHDSYGTHMGEATDKLARVLREQFVTMYKGNVLENFVEQLREQIPMELAEKLPPLPSVGTLDLDAILDSRYFFA